ncbi:hypothetical protein ABT084_18965 [Streptomyces sp. NPDC002138]|uniref:hypothetical protein n=1 Tax=Streptomyces sp. NPDC002138 TaxID=3154410 RepID=UPI00331BB195
MGRRITQPTGSRATHAEPSEPSPDDIHWPGERRSAIGIAALLFAALFVLDASVGRLDVTHGALWAGLAALVFVILWPLRVCARPGLLMARGLLVRNSVRTDSLVSVQWSDGVAQRLVLRDTDGSRVEIDPTVLVRSPAMWRRLDSDTRTSMRRGTLLSGATALRELAQRIDGETARTVFKVSSLQ